MAEDKVTAIETADMPEFGTMPNDYAITEELLERLRAGTILRVPAKGFGVVYLKFKGGIQDA